MARKKVGWKSNFKSVVLNPAFGVRVHPPPDPVDWSMEYEMQFCPILFTPRDHRRLAQAISWTERFRIVIAEARKAGHRIDHVLVNSEGEQKLLMEVSFVAAQLSVQPSKGQLHIGHYMGVDIFHSPGQAEMIVFVVETPQGYFTITGNDIKPYAHPGPVFVMEIKP